MTKLEFDSDRLIEASLPLMREGDERLLIEDPTAGYSQRFEFRGAPP